MEGVSASSAPERHPEKTVKLNPLAGKPAPASLLVDVPRLITAYYTAQPDPRQVTQRVAFGTSGHRGSAFDAAFNERHILAITQAICLYRAQQNIDGPLFLGIDTHADRKSTRLNSSHSELSRMPSSA